MRIRSFSWSCLPEEFLCCSTRERPSGRSRFTATRVAVLLRFLLQGRQDAVGSERQRGDADAEGVAHGIADRRAAGNHRRLTEADHAAGALALGLEQLDDDLAD